MDARHSAKDRRVRLQATNNFLRVKSINKGWDGVHARRVEVLHKHLQRTRNALHREASLLREELRTMRQNVSYLDDRDLQIKILKRDMERAKERKPDFLKEEEVDGVATVVLLSSRRRTSMGVLGNGHDGVDEKSCAIDGKDPMKKVPSLAPIPSPSGGRDLRSPSVPCRYYKAERRPVPGCRYFPCVWPRTYLGNDLLGNTDDVAHRSVPTLAASPGLLGKNGQTRVRSLDQTRVFQVSSTTDTLPAVESGIPGPQELRERYILESSKADNSVEAYSQQQQSKEYDDSDGEHCGRNRVDGRLSTPSEAIGDRERQREVTTGQGDKDVTRPPCPRKSVSFLEDKLEPDNNSTGTSAPRSPSPQTSKLLVSSDSIDSTPETQKIVPPTKTSGTIDDNHDFGMETRLRIQRKTRHRVEALAVAMDNQRRRNEENRPTPRETQYGQATPLRVLLKEGNPSVYAKKSGLCL